MERRETQEAVSASDMRLINWANILALLIGVLLIAIAIRSFGAEMPPVPYLTNTEERTYIGQRLYTESGVEVGLRPDLAEEYKHRPAAK